MTPQGQAAFADENTDSADPIRVAVVGTGAIAQVVHLPTLSEMQGVEVGALRDADFSKARAIASRFGIERIHRTDDDIFEDPAIDGVIICTPSHLHEEQTIAALRNGKHVLVEKPVALSAEGAERVIAAAREANRSVMVALNNRYRPDSRAMKPFATNGELGQIFFLKTGMLQRKVRVVRPTWRHKAETAGGGALMDLGVQVLDLALWMLDYPEPKRIVAHLRGTEGLEVEDSAAVMLELDDGVVISLEVTWSLIAERDKQYLQMLGSHGSANMTPLSVRKEVEHGLLDVTPAIPAGRANAYTATYREQLSHFVGVIRGTREAPLPHEQVKLMQIIAKAYESGRSGKEVSF